MKTNLISLALGIVLLSVPVLIVQAQSGEATSAEEVASTTPPIADEVDTVVVPPQEHSTSTPEEVSNATTTEDIVDTQGEVLGVATSTEQTTESGESENAETVSSLATTTEAIEPTLLEIADTDAASTSAAAVIEEIREAQASYYAEHGKYLQILLGNTLPEYESGTVSEKLGRNIPDDMRIDVYTGPKGSGYQVTYEENGTIYTVGFGPEAEHRTYSYPAPAASATSTEATL